jgi:hypothetical protein
MNVIIILWHLHRICFSIVALVGLILKEMKTTAAAARQSSEKNKGNSALRDAMKRLCKVGAIVGVLQLTNMVTTIWTSEKLESWTVSSDLWMLARTSEVGIVVPRWVVSPPLACP